MIRSFSFFLKETIDGIRRHSTGSIVTFLQVFISLFFLGVCLIVIINVNHFVDNFLNNLEMGAFLADDLTHEQTEDLMDTIKHLPGVRDVEYISKEEAFTIMQERSTMDISDLVRTNPFPASIKITVDSPQAASDLASPIRRMTGITEVNYAKEQLQVYLPVFHLVEFVCFFLTIVTVIATLFTIMNTVRLAIFTRRKEIRIMQLVGATSWFIRVPFLIEGLVYGLIGAFLAMLILGVGYELVIGGMAKRSIYLPGMLDFNVMISNLAIMMFILGGFTSIIASLIAVGKHLEEDIYRPVPQQQQGVVA
jgi:cell division transport system permease protein